MNFSNAALYDVTRGGSNRMDYLNTDNQFRNRFLPPKPNQIQTKSNQNQKQENIQCYPGTNILMTSSINPEPAHHMNTRLTRRKRYYPGTQIEMPPEEEDYYYERGHVRTDEEMGLPEDIVAFDQTPNRGVNKLTIDDLQLNENLPIPEREIPDLNAMSEYTDPDIQNEDENRNRNLPIISISEMEENELNEDVDEMEEKEKDEMTVSGKSREIGYHSFDDVKRALRSEDGIRTYRPGSHLGSYPILKPGENLFGEHMNFSDTLKNNPFHQNSDKSLVPRHYYISIDSRDRDRTQYPNPAQYRVEMKPVDGYMGAYISRDFKEIVSIELLSAVYPNTNNVLNNLYLVLVIPEIDDNYDATNTTTTKGFAKLYPQATFGNHVHAKIDGVEYVRKQWRVSNLKNLSKMTIELRLPNGNLFNFGTDTIPPIAINEDLQNSFTFKITVLEPDTSRLGRQNT